MPSRRVSVPCMCPEDGVRVGRSRQCQRDAVARAWSKLATSTPGTTPEAGSLLTVFFVNATLGASYLLAITPPPDPRPMLPLTAVTSTAAAAAMLDPTRLAILERLRAPGSAASVAARLGVPRQRIGYHIRELERAGLVAPVSERAHGGLIERLVQASAAGYVVAPQALGPVAADPATVVDHFSTAYQLAVAARIIRDLAELRARADRTKKAVPTLTLDTCVRVASAEAQHAFATELANAVARVVEKYHDDQSPNGRTFACAVTVHPHVAPGDIVPTP